MSKARKRLHISTSIENQPNTIAISDNIGLDKLTSVANLNSYRDNWLLRHFDDVAEGNVSVMDVADASDASLRECTAPSIRAHANSGVPPKWHSTSSDPLSVTTKSCVVTDDDNCDWQQSVELHPRAQKNHDGQSFNSHSAEVCCSSHDMVASNPATTDYLPIESKIRRMSFDLTHIGRSTITAGTLHIGPNCVHDAGKIFKMYCIL